MRDWGWVGSALDSSGRFGRARAVISQGRFREFVWLSGAMPGGPQQCGAQAALPSGCSLIELGEEICALPGLVDGHTHLLGLGLKHSRPDLSKARSKRELLETIEAWLDEHPGDTPVQGEGWDQSAWPHPALPVRSELDRLCEKRVLVLRRVCGHVAVLNSAALREFGIEWPNLDPETGLAREALPLALSRLLPPSGEQLDQGLAWAQQEAWRFGVTGIQEMGIGSGFRVFAESQAAGRLHLRVTHFFGREALPRLVEDGLVAGLGGDRLRVGGIKVFLDGSIGGRSAAVRRPYPRVDGADSRPRSAGEEERGLLLLSDGELRTILADGAGAGYQTAMHAIGDQASDQAIRVVESLRDEGMNFPAPGPRLEHAEMLDEELLSRAVRAGFLISMQPNFTARWQNSGGLYEQVLGLERARALNPYRSVSRTDRLLFGSDTMPMSPLLGLRGALGHPVAEQRLPLAEAVRAYTSRAASAITHPFPQGSLQEGGYADCVFLHIPESARDVWRQLLEGAILPFPEEIRPVATFVDGGLRFSDPAFSTAPWVFPSV